MYGMIDDTRIPRLIKFSSVPLSSEKLDIDLNDEILFMCSNYNSTFIYLSVCICLVPFHLSWCDNNGNNSNNNNFLK